MISFPGKILSAHDGAPARFYTVQFIFMALISSPGDTKGTQKLPVPVTTSARADENGQFHALADAEGTPQGPVDVQVSAPSGQTVLNSQVTIDEARRGLSLSVPIIDPFVVTPSDDPTGGQRLRINGQVIDARGRTVPIGLPVVIWGRDLVDTGGSPNLERPLLVGETQADGRFSTDWLPIQLALAEGRVDGGPPTPVALDDSKRLPRQILLIINLEDVGQGKTGNDCNCEPTPPRAPDPADLTNNPAAYSQDLNGGCVDLTTPNRTLEEFSYYMVVRTSEPNVKGVTLGVRRTLPPDLLVDLLGVSIASNALTLSTRLSNSIQPALRLPAAGLQLGIQAASALVRQDRPPSLAEIERATWLSEVSHTKGQIDAGLRQSVGRVEMDALNAIDWDDTPTIHVAMDIAHGHVLRYREVWRADGYSLGDLLYSLPLAPGQRRQIAVIDWERRATSTQEEQLEFEEELDAMLSRDRDIREIVNSSLNESTRAGSRNTTWGVAGGIGAGFIGSGFGIFGGVAGGASGSDSKSWQRSSRQFSADSLQSLRDRVAQRSSSVRNERSTVIQTVNQGETLRAETELVANYNHCHAITVEYFEVLRHFLVTHELAEVQECLFVPLPITEFDRGKALRWREPLGRFLKDRKLGGGFLAIERIADNWVGWDFPVARFSEEAPETLEGELRISFLLPRPRDSDDGKYQVDMWRPYAFLLPVDTLELFTARLNEKNARERDRIFREEVAPEIAKNMINHLRFAYVDSNGGQVEISMDGSLVSRYHESGPLYVSLNPAGGLPNIPREDIAYFKVWFDGPPLPPDAQVIVHSGRLRYSSPHMTTFLFNAPRILDDLRNNDPVLVPTPVSRAELRNPRQEDIDLATRLVTHLNANLEFYHQVIWLSLDTQRRYMLLDAVIVPGLGGRSVASVCVNQIIGLAGNSLILPAAPGQRLDPTIETVDDAGHPIRLKDAYSVSPAPPLRISVPTRGVYAEAVAGECNVCEKIDDNRYWNWTTAGQLALPAIDTVSTGTRNSPEPDLTPTGLPSPLVSIQNAPAVPDPFGLSAAFQLLSKPEVFRDITGLQGTQQNARAAFDASISAAAAIGDQAATLARQNELSRNAERMLDRIQQAKTDGLLSPAVAQALANSALKGLIGDPQGGAQSPEKDPAVQKVLDKSAQSANADIRVSNPAETVEVSFQDDAPVVVGAASVPSTFDVAPPDDLAFIKQDVVIEKMNLSGSVVTSFTESRSTTYIGVKNILSAADLAILESNNFLRKDPADAANFQLLRRLRITHPAKFGSLTKINGRGRLPIVVIAHGHHASWSVAGEIRNHEGYSYLQDELARHNIVSVSVDTNAAETFNSYAAMRGEMILGALDALRILDTTRGSRFFGRLDFDKVALLGHSRGGDGVMKAAELNAARPVGVFDPAKPDEKKRCKILAVCGLAPTDFTGMFTPAAQTRSIGTAQAGFLGMFYGALDGDVAGFEGAKSFTGTAFRHYDRATCDKAMVFFDGCNHNRFNRIWADDELGVMPTDAVPGSRLLSRGDHEKLFNEFFVGLMRWKLLGETSQRGLFDGSKVNSLGAGVSLQWAFGSQVDSLDEMGDPNNSLVGTRTLANSSVSQFSDIVIGARRLVDETNHQTGVLLVNPGLPGPVAPVLKIDLGLLDNHDWSGYDAFTFRVSALFDLSSIANIAAGPLPDFIITINDAHSGSSSFDASVLATSVARRSPIFHEALRFVGTISSSSKADPTVITTPKNHGLSTGNRVMIRSHSGAAPDINGLHTITVKSPKTFTIPVKVTTAGTGGILHVVENCSVLRLETLAVEFAPIRLSPAGVNLSDVASLIITPPANFASEMMFDSLRLITV